MSEELGKMYELGVSLGLGSFFVSSLAVPDPTSDPVHIGGVFNDDKNFAEYAIDTVSVDVKLIGELKLLDVGVVAGVQLPSLSTAIQAVINDPSSLVNGFSTIQNTFEEVRTNISNGLSATHSPYLAPYNLGVCIGIGEGQASSSDRTQLQLPRTR